MPFSFTQTISLGERKQQLNGLLPITVPLFQHDYIPFMKQLLIFSTTFMPVAKLQIDFILSLELEVIYLYRFQLLFKCKLRIFHGTLILGFS